MKGDVIAIKYVVGDSFATDEMKAETNGSSVEYHIETENKVQWIVVNQQSKAQKTVRSMRFKADAVVSVVEHPAKPV